MFLLRSSLKIILLLSGTLVMANALKAQFILSGTVYDSSKINFVEGVRVVSTGGMFSVTDSMGNYHLKVLDKDSVAFNFRNKPTQKFPVKSIPDPSHFDISLRVTVRGKYSTLKEVVVHSKSYRQDSLENRQTYADVFDYRKPGVRPSITPDGAVGADLDELINMFRFKRNRRLHAFQKRLEMQEQDSYVNYRFNKTLVGRMTQLKGEQLDTFMVRYRPSYEFITNAGEIQFNQYILNSSYEYKIALLKQEAKKNDP
jgi:hypothetical protein